MSRHLPLHGMLFLLAATGCFNPADLAGRKDDPAAEQNVAADPLQAPPVENAQAPANAAAPPAQPMDIAKVQWRLVDKKEAFEKNPNLKVIDTTQLGGQAQGYLTAVSQAYRSAKTRVQILNLQHQLDIHKELNDGKWPSFNEFSTLMRQNQVELDNVYPWEIFAYDSEAGQILLLEDPDLRKKMRQEAGLPVD